MRCFRVFFLSFNYTDDLIYAAIAQVGVVFFLGVFQIVGGIKPFFFWTREIARNPDQCV